MKAGAEGVKRVFPRSLFGNLMAIHIVMAAIAAITLPFGVAILLHRTAERYQRDLLRGQAQSVAAALGPKRGGASVAGADMIGNGLSVAVVDVGGRVETIRGPARPAIVDGAPLAGQARFFRRGEIQAISWPTRGRWVLVSQDAAAPEAVTDDIVRTFLRQFAFLLLPIAALLPLVGAFFLRRITRRLQAVSAIATGIGPRDFDRRLPRDVLPIEVEPLAVATNDALDRLEKGYRIQAAFAADIAHELRTPLAIVRLRADTVGDEEQRLALLSGIDRASRVVTQMLGLADLERRVEDCGETVDLLAIAEGVVASRAPAIIGGGRSIALDDLGHGTMLGFPGPLMLALENLIDNAARHTPPGTHILVTVGPGPQCAVSDDGDGVPPEALDRLKDRFFRHQGGRQEGHGIGLSIVQRVAEAHHGTLDLSPGPGGRGIAFAMMMRAA